MALLEIFSSSDVDGGDPRNGRECFRGDRRSGSSTDLTSCSLDDGLIVDTVILETRIKVIV